jgi:Xaa-Pro aminopeptidase
MKYTPLPKEIYQRNRAKFAAKMAKNAVAIFNANDILPTNADGTMKFRQNNDLFYLCGIDQEETILLLAPDCPNPAWREVLFLRETNDHIAVWEGHKYTKEEGYAASGIETIQWLPTFDSLFNSVVNLSERIYLNTNEHLRAGVVVETRDARFIQTCKEKYPLHIVERAAPLMHELRGVKEPEEIQQLQVACDITEKGFRRVLGMV